MTKPIPNSSLAPEGKPVEPIEAPDAGRHTQRVSVEPEPAIEEPINELAQAQGELAIAKAQIADLKDQLLRAEAGNQNLRRRAEEDVAKARKFGIEHFADGLLPVLDSLEAGLAIEAATTAQLREGAEATLRQLRSALERNRVLAIDPPVGEKFDPSRHQAISTAVSDQPANTIVSVLQKGYLIAERVLRPALVTVAATP